MKRTTFLLCILSAVILSGCAYLDDVIPVPDPADPSDPADPADPPGPIAENEHDACFLRYGARIPDGRLMNKTSYQYDFATAKEMIDWELGIGCDTTYIYLSNQGDGPPVSIFDGVFGGNLNEGRIDQIKAVLDYARGKGMRVVGWLFGDDSPAISTDEDGNTVETFQIFEASLDTKKQFVRDAVRIFDPYVDEWVIALEGDEHMNDDIRPLAEFIDGLTDEPIGTHQIDDHFDHALFPQVDVCFYQFGFGKSEAFIEQKTRDVKAALGGKRFIAAEYDKDGGTAGAMFRGDAAIRGGADGTGNSRSQD